MGQIIGAEIERFLAHEVTVTEAEPRNLAEGFAVLRRTEAIKLADDYGVEFGQITAMTDMVPLLDTAWIQGKFPAPKSVEDSVAAKVKADLMADPEFLRAALKVAEGSTQAQAPTLVAPLEAGGMADYLAMDWNEIRECAKAKGMKIHGMKRPEIVNALVAMGG